MQMVYNICLKSVTSLKKEDGMVVAQVDDSQAQLNLCNITIG